MNFLYKKTHTLKKTITMWERMITQLHQFGNLAGRANRASIHHVARLLQLLFPLGSWEFDLMGGWGCISSSNTIHSLLLNSSDSRCRLQGGVTNNTTRIWHRLQQYKTVLISSWAKYLFVFVFVVIVAVQAHLHHRMMLEHYYYYCQVPTLCVLRGTLLFILVCIQIYRQGL